MNTSPSDQTVDLEFADVFLDHNDAQGQSWTLHDLWAKDSNGKWGAAAGTFQKTFDGIKVAPHATKIWKVVRADNAKRDEL
jgi:alpha-galactosidase